MTSSDHPLPLKSCAATTGAMPRRAQPLRTRSLRALSLAALSLAALCLLPLAACEAAAEEDAPTVDHARATLVAVGESGVGGSVDFTRTAAGVRVSGRITGLEPGLHGFHVHEYGDVSARGDGASAGGHFAPRGHDHGSREANRRHVGDLGNVEADADGVATFDFTDAVIGLDGAHSIIGRAVVVHAGEDSFSQPAGGAGARVAFGVIGIAAPEDGS